MKSILLIIILQVILYSYGFSGGYECVKYELEFRLKNVTIKGFYLSGNYQKLLDFHENEFIDMLIGMKDSVLVFKKITTLKYPILKNVIRDSCDFTFTAAYPKDVIKINPKDIISIKLIGTEPCCVCNKKSDYSWMGNHTNVLTELTNDEINQLMSPPNAFYYFEYVEYTYIYAINYNPSIKENELKNICETLKKKYNYSTYNHFKQEMKKKGIITFIVAQDL